MEYSPVIKEKISKKGSSACYDRLTDAILTDNNSIEKQVKSYYQNIQKPTGHGKESGDTRIFNQIKHLKPITPYGTKRPQKS